MTALVAIILPIWVVYDTLVIQKKMVVGEKLIWILGSFLIPILLPIIYLIVVKRNNKYLLNKKNNLTEKKKYERLEKLFNLKEKGAITEKEYKKEKEKLF